MLLERAFNQYLIKVINTLVGHVVIIIRQTNKIYIITINILMLLKLLALNEIKNEINNFSKEK